MTLPDPRNEDIVVFVGDRLVPRREARVSVFDSVVQGGDAVWEGLRVYNGRIAALDGHLERLQNSAKALAFASVPSSDEVSAAIFSTLEANGMRDGALADKKNVGVIRFRNESLNVEHDGAVDTGDIGLDRGENVVQQIIVMNFRIETLRRIAPGRGRDDAYAVV